MDRKEIKGKAKELIRNNKWHILKPAIIMFLISFGIALVAGLIDYAIGDFSTTTVEFGTITYEYYEGGVFTALAEIALSIAGILFSVGYAMYILTFIRGGKSDIKGIIDFSLKNWKIIILASLLAAVNIWLGFILLIIPGIMASFGLLFIKEVIADNTDLSVTDCLRKTWNITNGHKFDLFVLGLSFIGWAIIANFTLGILYIWLAPYMIVTFALAYDTLKDNK